MTQGELEGWLRDGRVVGQWDEGTVKRLIGECQAEARRATDSGDSPFGCVIADGDGNVVERGRNTANTAYDPTAHAEVNAIRQLCARLSTTRLDGYVLVANAASCPMCASAAMQARIRTFCYGAPSEPHMDPWLTMEEVAARSKHRIEIVGLVLAGECAEQIRSGRAAMPKDDPGEA